MNIGGVSFHRPSPASRLIHAEGYAASLMPPIHNFGLYLGDNCLFVRKHLRNKIVDEIMSRGVQLTDLFDTLPAEEAQRESK